MPTAIISGASVGIGCETARLFGADGYTVYNLSRRPCPLPGVHNLHCDLGDAQQTAEVLQQLCASLMQAGGPGDGDSGPVALIHNASLMLKDSVTDCGDEALARVLRVNVSAVNQLNRALLPVMGAGSSILYVGSTLSEKAVPGAFSYVVSKHAQAGLMRATCQDTMGSGIHTALICPGFTDTEMLRTHLHNDPEIIRSIGSMNSFNRLIEPQEIAALIHWAHYNPVINGAVLHANLGQRES
jgi:NAD(P)-dependent dehydrogenase (short-subunit alcohol dehydrogenase family)